MFLIYDETISQNLLILQNIFELARFTVNLN